MDSIIAEDHPQLKSPPELELLSAAMPSDVPEDTLPGEDPPQLKNLPEVELLGASMPSDVPEDTLPEVTSLMLSEARITKGDASEDELPTESALLGPDNPTNSSKGGNDEQKGEALVIPEKVEVGEKMMNEPEVAVKKRFILIRATGANKPPVGKNGQSQALLLG